MTTRKVSAVMAVSGEAPVSLKEELKLAKGVMKELTHSLADCTKAKAAQEKVIAKLEVAIEKEAIKKAAKK